MSWINYKNKCETLANRVESIYHKTGASFVFVWIEDAATFQLSFTATADFADLLATQVSEPLSKFFHAATNHHTSNCDDSSFWSIIGERNTKNFIVTAPGQSKISKRKATEDGRQPDFIMIDLEILQKEGFPFVFLYLPQRKSATDAQATISKVFPATHAATLVDTDGWKQLLTANKRLTMPRRKITVVNRMQAATRPRLRPTHLRDNDLGSQRHGET